jgi:hypothetical protein
MNPRFCRCVKTIEAGSILGNFFVDLACIFGFYFLFLLYAFENLSYIFGTLVSYLLGPVLRSFAMSLLLYWELEHFDRGISQNGICPFVQFVFLLLLRTVWECFKYTVGKQDGLQLFRYMMMIRENHQNGRKFTIATGRCCLHRKDSSICNPSFHKVLGLKNISAEGVNSRTWKSALVFAGKEV